MQLKENQDAILYMWYKAESALTKRLGLLNRLPDWATHRFSSLEELKQTYRERLDYEFRTIKNMGFCSYFLIIADCIDYCRKNSIPVGPGRGSAAGCLCSYLLNITKIDPIRYNLLFERFLNPDRVSMPDIDVDYSQEYRYKIKEYFTAKYGEDKVASIGTFSRMKVRAAIKDIVRSLDLVGSESFKLADAIAKTLEDEEENITFAEALSNDEFRGYMQKYPIIAERIRQYEDILRQMSMHAAGVLISANKFDESLPMMVDKKGMVLTAYDGKTIEDLKYLKLDTLGLKNLDIIEDCKANIRKIRGYSPTISIVGIPIRPDEPPEETRARIDALPDGQKKQASKAFQLLRDGKTLGVFQCERSVTASLLRRSMTNSIDDLAEVIALIRPGPRKAGSTEVYTARKIKEEPISYILELDPVPTAITKALDECETDEKREALRAEIISYLEKDLISGSDEPTEIDTKSRWGAALIKEISGQDYLKRTPSICCWIAKLEDPDRVNFRFDYIDPICRNTQGLPLFQEQLMQIAVRCAGFTKGESDTLRKGVGKKNAKVIKKIGEQFVSAMMKGGELNPKGASLREAQFLWYKFILPYGSYGFNLSHSIAYGFISYETAFLKANYPGEFYAALLSHEGNQNKINLIIAEAKAAGIKFLQPNINQSTYRFEIIDESTIVYALTLAKGVGDKAVDRIVSNRPYKNMVDFIGRADCNAKTAKTLIAGGAFDNAFETEKVTRKNYYDFFRDCRTKLKRQTERLLKEHLLAKYNLHPPKYANKEAREKAKEDGTYITAGKWFDNLLATNEDFNRDWRAGQAKEIEEFKYDWDAPVTISKKGVAQAVVRDSGDDRSDWTQEEVYDIEEMIYGTTISGHRLDPYREFEQSFNDKCESFGLAKHSISDDLGKLKLGSEVYLFAIGTEIKSKRPYAKDNKSFTRRFEIEDRTGKEIITVFEKNYQAVGSPEDKYTCLSILDRKLPYRPVMILKCKVNDWNGNRNLVLNDVIEWINKDEIVYKIENDIYTELNLGDDEDDDGDEERDLASND